MKSLLVVAASVLALGGLLFTACATGDAPVFQVESPAGSGTWVAVDGEPAWVTSPPSEAGKLFFVVEVRSNLHSIVFSPGGPSAEKEATQFLRTRLLPELPNPEITRILAAVPGVLRLVGRACREEVLSREAIPGNTLCTGWALWELPVQPLLDVVPERDRARIAGVLRVR